MLSEKFFAYYPEKIVWVGLIVVGIMTGGLATFGILDLSEGIERLSEIKRIKPPSRRTETLDICLLPGGAHLWRCPIPDVRQQIAFSFDPPRPEEVDQSLQLSVRLKQALISQRFGVPCRIDLAYSSGVLTFSETESPFYLQIEREKEELIGTVFVNGDTAEPFIVHVESNPVQTARDFAEGSAFRLLAESRWWGRDLCYPLYFEGKIIHRLDIGSPMESKILDWQEGQWLLFKEGQWKAVSDLTDVSQAPIARIRSAMSGGLEIEGWEGERHVRFVLPQISLPPFKIKPEELFGSIRVRSDKQISCVLDKQCLILRINDWVIKVGDRWKILRKAEEKEAFLKGKIVGELFILDQISNKQGQKSIAGHMYNLARTQKSAIELPVLGKKASSSRLQTKAEPKGRHQ